MKKIGIVFSGFGSQFVGMAKDVYDESRQAQEYFEEAYNCLNINFVKLCFASSDEELSKIDNAYLAVFLTDLVLYNLLTEAGITPDVLTGYGVGSYAALFAAGAFTFPDGLYLLNKYAIFYQEFLDQHKNLRALEIDGLSLRKLRTICQELSSEQDQLFVSGVMSETCQIVTGQNKLIKKLEQILNSPEYVMQVNIKPHNLAASINCELAQDLIDNFKIYLAKVDLKTLNTPVLSVLTGKLITGNKEVKKELIDQELNPVMWQKVVQGLASCDVIIEVGPGQTLANQIQQVYPDKHVFTLNQKTDMLKIKEALGLNTQDQTSYEE